MKSLTLLGVLSIGLVGCSARSQYKRGYNEGMRDVKKGVYSQRWLGYQAGYKYQEWRETK